MRDNVYNQSDVAYGSVPKETKNNRGMIPTKQFGKGKMPQDSKVVTKSHVKIEKHRHKEHR